MDKILALHMIDPDGPLSIIECCHPKQSNKTRVIQAAAGGNRTFWKTLCADRFSNPDLLTMKDEERHSWGREVVDPKWV